MDHICHLTVLNPALHSRIYFKEARSQAKAGFRVTVVGQDGAEEPYEKDGVRIVPTGVFGRLSRQRRTARQWMVDVAARERADVYWIHAPELLPVGQALKVARPEVRVIYDVHEDYAANIRFGEGYPGPLTGGLAAWVRRQQAEFCRWGDGLVYAEESYEGLMDFPRERTVILRNKFQRPEGGANGRAMPRPYILYTGTIAREWGVFRTLEFWQWLRRRRDLDLVVAGHTHNTALLVEMEEYVAGAGLQDEFHLIGGAKYVDHGQIVDLIEDCVAGTAFYALEDHLRSKVPTKWYEFMGCRKPLFYSRNARWDAIRRTHGFGLPVDFPMSWMEMDGWMTYLKEPQPAIDPKYWSWEPEAVAMVNFLNQVLS